MPNAVGASATFNVATSGGITVTLDIPVALGGLVFGNSAAAGVGCTIAGPDLMTFDNSGSGAAISVAYGTHAIDVPILLNDNLTVLSGGTSPGVKSGGRWHH